MEHFDIIGHAGKHIYISNKYLHHVHAFYKFLHLEAKGMHILKINFSTYNNWDNML